MTVVLALTASCTKSTPTTGDSEPATPARAEQPTKAVQPAEAEAIAEPSFMCDLSGTYRFRFLSNGQEGWWFRFRVEDQSATLLEPIDVLALDAGPLRLTTDPQKCQLVLGTEGRAVGELTVSLTLDSNTSFTGRLNRTKAHNEAEKARVIHGVRDEGPPQPDAACVVPGIYELALDPKVAWKNSDPPDDRSCADAPSFVSPVFVRVEPFGETLAVTMRDYEPPHAETWASDKLVRHGDCEITVELGDDTLQLEARLELSTDGITGTATYADYQIVEDGFEGENIWDCVGHDIPVTGTLVK